MTTFRLPRVEKQWGGPDAHPIVRASEMPRSVQQLTLPVQQLYSGREIRPHGLPRLHHMHVVPNAQVFPGAHGGSQMLAMHVPTPPVDMQSPEQHETAPNPCEQSPPSGRQVSSRQKQNGRPGGASQPHWPDWQSPSTLHSPRSGTIPPPTHSPVIASQRPSHSQAVQLTAPVAPL